MKVLTEVVTSLESGARPKGGVNGDGDIPSLGAEHLSDDGGFNFKKIKRISNHFFSSMRSGHIQTNDILIVKDGATTGKVSLVGSQFPFKKATVNEHVFILRVNKEIACPIYVHHYLRTQKGKEQILKDFRGATVGGISRSFVDKVQIPLPPLAEQQRIAAILDKAEELKRKRESTIAKLDELAQSTFMEMFGEDRMKGKNLPLVTLESLLKNGPQNGLYKPSSQYGSGTPILRIDSFYDGTVTKLESLKRVQLEQNDIDIYSLNENDIVINRVNSLEYLGKSALIPYLKEPTVFESNMMRLCLNEDLVDPVFFIQYLQTKDTKTQILSCAKNSVNQSSINQQDVKALTIRLPQLNDQKIFSKTIKKIQSQKINNYVQSSNQITALLSSLQHQAFTTGFSA